MSEEGIMDALHEIARHLDRIYDSMATGLTVEESRALIAMEDRLEDISKGIDRIAYVLESKLK